MAIPNSNFDAILSTTLNNYRDKLTDNVFTARFLTYWLMSKNRIKMYSGGAKIIEQLMYAKNNTVSSYAGYDPISLAPQEGISAAEYEWRQVAASIGISGIEEAKNNGEAELIDLLEARIMQAEESMREDFNTMFFGDGSGNGGKDFNGLGNLVEASGTVGGINRATAGNEWWRSYEDNDAVALAVADMNTAYNTASVGNDHPDFSVTTQILFEKYESLLTPNIRYTDTKTADAGFQNLLFKGIPIAFDTACTAGVMYFLNSKYIKLVGHTDKWFDQTPFQNTVGTDARFALILCYGNLVLSNAKKQGKLTAKTA